jgi:hypothetical protein
MKKEVEHPDHYTLGGIETLDFIRAKLTPEEFRGYLRGQIMKYVSRLGMKDAPEIDAGKIRFYSQRLEELMDAQAESKSRGD